MVRAVRTSSNVNARRRTRPVRPAVGVRAGDAITRIHPHVIVGLQGLWLAGTQRGTHSSRQSPQLEGQRPGQRGAEGDFLVLLRRAVRQEHRHGGPRSRRGARGGGVHHFARIGIGDGSRIVAADRSEADAPGQRILHHQRGVGAVRRDSRRVAARPELGSVRRRAEIAAARLDGEPIRPAFRDGPRPHRGPLTGHLVRGRFQARVGVHAFDGWNGHPRHDKHQRHHDHQFKQRVAASHGPLRVRRPGPAHQLPTGSPPPQSQLTSKPSLLLCALGVT